MHGLVDQRKRRDNIKELDEAGRRKRLTRDVIVRESREHAELHSIPTK
jgi:hypothetical protein